MLTVQVGKGLVSTNIDILTKNPLCFSESAIMLLGELKMRIVTNSYCS